MMGPQILLNCLWWYLHSLGRGLAEMDPGKVVSRIWKRLYDVWATTVLKYG